MNQDLQEMRTPANTRLTTAAIAGADRKSATIDANFNPIDDELIDNRLDRPVSSPQLLAEQPQPLYPEDSEKTLSTAAGDAIEFQSTYESPHAGSVPSSNSGRAEPLFSASESNQLNSRWDAVQVAFVDEPRQAVQKADELVASAIQRLAEVFAEERARLEEQWDRGDSVSTEDLRVAMQRYRSFFRRLLAV